MRERLPRFSVAASSSGLYIYQPFLVVFLLLAPWSVTALNKPILVLLFLLCAGFWGLKVAGTRSLTLDVFSRLIISLYFLAFFVGFLALVLSIPEIQGDYLSAVIPGRLFTLTAICLMLVLAFDIVNVASSRFLTLSLRVALLSLFLFILGGLWQLAETFLGVPFPFETRDWIHGVPDHLRAVFPGRVTSFAEEPNFLAPLLIEFILLARMLIAPGRKRKFALLLGLGTLVATLSGGAYANLVIIALVMGGLSLLDFFGTLRVRPRHVFLFLAVLAALVYVAVFLFDNLIFDYVVAKFAHEATGGSSRSVFLTALVQLWLDTDPARMIVGHGVATMSILPNFGMDLEYFLFRISNNFYLDVLWESGMAGLLLVLGLFGVLLRIGWVNRRESMAYETGFLLSIHLAVTSLYRSEYLSTHFAWVLVVILCCYTLGAHQKQEYRRAL